MLKIKIPKKNNHKYRYICNGYNNFSLSIHIQYYDDVAYGNKCFLTYDKDCDAWSIKPEDMVVATPYRIDRPISNKALYRKLKRWNLPAGSKAVLYYKWSDVRDEVYLRFKFVDIPIKYK